MSKLPEDLDLDLPDWTGQEPQPPLSLAEIVALCEKMLPYWNAERFAKDPPPLPDRPFSLVDDESQP